MCKPLKQRIKWYKVERRIPRLLEHAIDIVFRSSYTQHPVRIVAERVLERRTEFGKQCCINAGFSKHVRCTAGLVGSISRAASMGG